MQPIEDDLMRRAALVLPCNEQESVALELIQHGREPNSSHKMYARNFDQ